MSIEKVEMFTVVCDNCKESADEGTDYSCWNDENGAKDVAMEAGFIKENGNDYCPKCYSYNDEDELIIDYSRTKGKCNVCNQFLDIDDECPTGHRQT